MSNREICTQLLDGFSEYQLENVIGVLRNLRDLAFRSFSEDTHSEDPFFSEVNQARLRRAAADMEAGVNVSIHEIEAGDD